MCLLWRKRRELGLSFRSAKTANLVEDVDRFGGFKVMKKPEEPQEQAAPIVHIELPHLPEVCPLGLELLETRVIQVHPWGAKHGFRVGDIIVDISGVAVHTFEEVWHRVQIERARHPERFSVERRSPNQDERKHGGQPPQATGHAAGLTGAAAVSSQLRDAGHVAEGTGPAAAVVVAGTPLATSWSSSSGPFQAWTESDQESASATLTKQTSGNGFGELQLEPQEPKPPRITYAARPKSSFEEAFGDSKRDRLQEIVDRHNPRSGAGLSEVRFARDAWGRSIARVTR